MIRYLIPCLLGLSAATSAEGKPPIFAFVVSCKEAGRAGICLHGKHASGKPVLLLDRKTSRTCAAVTGGLAQVSFVKSFEVTRLRNAGACGKPEDYSLAIVGRKHVKYEPIPLDGVKSKAEVERLSGSRDAREALLVAFESARQARGEYFRVDIGFLTERAPLAYRLRGAGDHLAILQYQIKIFDEYVTGPLLIVNKKKVFAVMPVVDLCAPKPLAFKINRKRYLLASSDCCECGVVLERVIEIGGDGPKTVLQTRDFSG
ncbi:MAG: hypothetical protein JXO72_13505 [Vicinamibacteria bacterium]|nr:hypothetical protein [Vicinamibacteria bacterium]